MRRIVFSLFLVVLVRPCFSQVASDSASGHLIKQITTPASFLAFSKDDSNRAYLKDESRFGMTTAVQILPEMDCFLANHAKDDLRVTYEIWERENNGKTERINKAIRLVSLKSGDDTKTWSTKEANDAEALKDHHDKLKEVRAGFVK